MRLTKSTLKGLIKKELIEEQQTGKITDSDPYMAALRDRGRNPQDKFGDIEPAREREMPSAGSEAEIIDAWRGEAVNLGLDPDLGRIISALDDQQILTLNNYWESQTGQKMPLMDPVTGVVPAGGAQWPFSRDGGLNMDPHQMKVIKKALNMVGVPSASGLQPMPTPPIRESTRSISMKLTKSTLKDLIKEQMMERPRERPRATGGRRGAGYGKERITPGGPGARPGQGTDPRGKSPKRPRRMSRKLAWLEKQREALEAKLKAIEEKIDAIRYNESVSRHVTKSDLYDIIQEEYIDVLSERGPNIPDDAFDFPDMDKPQQSQQQAQKQQQKQRRSGRPTPEDAFKKLDQAKPGDEGYHQSTMKNWKMNAYMKSGMGRDAFEKALAPAKPEFKALLLKYYDEKNKAAIKKALGF